MAEINGRRRDMRALVYIGALVACLGIDQLVKLWIKSTTSVWEVNVMRFGDFLQIDHVVNTGCWYSMLEGWLPLFLVIGVIGFALELVMAFWATGQKVSPILLVGLGMMSGGGLGNMADRLFDGQVTDMLCFLTIDPMLTVNCADIFIGIGAFITLAWGIPAIIRWIFIHYGYGEPSVKTFRELWNSEPAA